MRLLCLCISHFDLRMRIPNKQTKTMKNFILHKARTGLLFLLFVLIGQSGWGQATLPVSRTAWDSAPTGWTDAASGSYLSTFACSGSNGGKFTLTGEKYTCNFSGIPNQLSFVVKSNATTTSALLVEESANGTTYTTLISLSATAALPTTCTTKGPYNLLSTSRFIRWTFTKGTQNLTIDDVSITSATPNAPTGISITPSNQQLSVAFTAPSSNGGSAITNYKYSTDGGTNFTAVSPASTSSPIVITGLTNGTSYNVQILAVNANGDGAATASTAATPRTIPSAPTIGTITPGNGQLSVAFTAGSDGGASITDYKWSVDGTTYTTRAGTTSPIVITGLTNGTAYTVRIRAVNAAGDGSVATAGSTSTPRTTPSAPTIGTITPGNGQLSVAFTAGSDGGSSITDYKWSVDGTTYTTRAGTGSPIVITGLTNGTAYTVRIRAVNAAGDGTVVTASAAATPATTPSAPTITSITPGNQELSVAFTSGSTGGSAITNYMYSTDGGSSFIAVSPAATTSPITITGLTNGTTYDVQIKAVNAQGDGSATATTQGTPTAAAVAPGAPTITSITPSNGQLSVAFTAGATGGSAITNYKYSTDGGGTFTAVSPAATTSPITITGLSNGTTYNVQIKAVNAVGDGTATVSTAATPATTPSAPTITGITAGNAQISVAFTAGASGGSSITNYKYSTDGGSTFTAVSPAATTSPITITGLSNGISYNVQIKAVNAIGDGTATASTAGTPATTPGAPTIGTATAGNGQATITFTAPVSNGGSAITSYTATSTPGSIIGTLNQAGSGTITVTGLTNGTAYTFTVKANNAAGVSTASGPSNSITPALTSPNATAATSILANGFTANWDAVTGASSGYLLDVSTSATFEATALATDLFISEYIEGSSNNKYIEIFNGTGATVDLSLYELGIASNGGGTPSYSTMTGSLVNGATIVYQNSGAALTLPAGVTAINSGACSFNGDDAIVLHKVGEAAATFVDVFGRVGSDPGTAWLSTSNSTLDKTLARKSSIISGVTSSPTGTGSGAFTTLETEWTQSNIDIVSGLGSHLISVNTPSFVSGYNAKPISGQSTVAYSVTGLSEATTYYYRVRATDGTASANSNVITITTKKTPTVSPVIGSYTYNGSAQGPNSIATLTPTPTSVTYSYVGVNPTSYGPSSTRPTSAGSYTVTATVEADANYVSASSSATAFTIAKAASSISVTGSTSFVYSGSAQGPATSDVTGSTGTVTYSYSGVSPTVYVTSATAPTNVGSYTVTASVAADTNYEAASSTPTAFGIVYPTNDWIGGTGNWNNTSNWSLSTLPLSTDNITISTGSPILNVSHTIDAGRTLTISGTGTLTINPNAILTIAGTADFGGKSVILKSDNSGDGAIGQVTGTLSNATNVTVERYIPARRAWRALTSPLKGSDTSLYASWQNGGTAVDPFNTGVELWGPSGTGLASGPGYNIRQYTTSGWADVNNTQSTNLFTSAANNAYMVFVTGGYGSNNIGNGQSAATTLKATGELITGTVNYSLSSTNHTLIGNPFASPISPELILANTANTNTALLFPYLWVWNPAYNTNGAYELYDKVAGSYSGGNLSAGTAIQSGQAFFVRTETASSSLTLTESMKSSSISNTFRNSNSVSPSIVRASFLKQTALDWMPLDGCIAAFYEGANPAADDADGKKMINSGENIGFVRNAVNLSSEHYPLVTNQDILNLKIWNTQQARYKLKLNTEEYTMTGVEAYLQDLYTGTTQQLNLDGSVQDYEFDVDPTVSASSGNRFRIVFTNIGLAVTDPEQGQLSIYPNPATGGKVTVSLPTGTFEGCSYELINVLGQVVRQDEIANSNSSQVLIPLTGLPTSWYALRIRKDNKVVYQGKLIINN